MRHARSGQIPFNCDFFGAGAHIHRTCGVWWVALSYLSWQRCAPFRPEKTQGDLPTLATAPEGSVCPVDTCPKGKATRRWGVKRAAGMVVPAATIERPVCGAGSSLAVLRFTLLEEQWRRMASVGLQLDYDDSHHRHVSTLATLRLALLEAQWRQNNDFHPIHISHILKPTNTTCHPSPRPGERWRSQVPPRTATVASVGKSPCVFSGRKGAHRCHGKKLRATHHTPPVR